jgi:hypothetical protein
VTFDDTHGFTTTFMAEGNGSHIHELLSRITVLSPSHMLYKADGKLQELVNATLTNGCGDITPTRKKHT